MTSKTLAEKVWDRHVVHAADGEPDLLYIDLHLVHEVTSPQAFDGLRLSGRGVPRARSKYYAATPPSTASPTFRWVTPARESCTSSRPSRAGRCRA